MAQEAGTGMPNELMVRFFGSFEIAADGALVNMASSRARRPWSLLQYLMLHRHEMVPRQQLMDALWPDGTSEAPDKALKNLVYRVRNAFAAKGMPFAQTVILYRGGNYTLNNELPWAFDFEQLEFCARQAADTSLPEEERCEAAVAAIGLYRGNFLAEQPFEDWVLPYSTRYRSLYFACVDTALKLLQLAGQDADIEQVCSRAIGIDPFEEHLHLAYMQALVRQGKQAVALKHYTALADMFFREMGVTPCEELQSLYQQISSQLNSQETDLHTIKDALKEDVWENNAFYCDFEVFRSLYRLEARAAERSGQAVFVALLTLCSPKGEALPEKRAVLCMGTLLNVLHQCLRRGDVVSRFSSTQFILMLPTINVENAQMVLGRVREHFATQKTCDGAVLEVKVQPLEPVMEG